MSGVVKWWYTWCGVVRCDAVVKCGNRVCGTVRHLGRGKEKDEMQLRKT